MRALLLAACLATTTAAAQAASFDCNKASTAAEKTICADPELSNLDERLAETYRAALSASFRPATLRQLQSTWLAERDRHPEPQALRQAYRTRLASLAGIGAAARRARQDVAADQAATSCTLLPEADADATCAVEAFGPVDGDGSLRYQLQSYKDGGLRTASGVVVFRPSDGGLRPIAAVAEDDVRFAPPRMVDSPAGKLLLLPGHVSGTGNFNAEVVYRDDDGHLTELDTRSWRRELDRRLPDGLAVWKGVFPDYGAFTASTPLWQRSDGNCCPTAGRADIGLDLQGDRLVIRDLAVARGADAAESAR